jgi:hypothetical protein
MLMESRAVTRIVRDTCFATCFQLGARERKGKITLDRSDGKG